MCSFQLPVILSRWLFLYERLKERKFEMNKHLLLTGLLAVLTLNNAFAQGYYDEEDDYYYEERPRYTRRSNYQQPRYRDVEYVREEAPRYRRVSSREAVRYREPTYHQAEYYGEPKVNKIRPYIGLDVAMTKAKLGKLNKMWSQDDDAEDFNHIKEKDALDNKNTAGSLVLGAKINRYFGVEAFYQISDKKDSTTKKNGTLPISIPVEYNDIYKGSMKYRAFGIDLQGYLPITQEIELLASLGMAKYYFDVTGSFQRSFPYEGFGGSSLNEIWKEDGDSLGIRLGIGVQYNVTDNIALRAMARYIKMNDDDYVKNLTELSLGLRYMF